MDYKFYVRFNESKIIYDDSIKLVENDYKLNRFLFEFDIEGGTKVFEMKTPTGKSWTKEIVDGILELADKNEQEETISILPETGEYEFEVSLYKNGGKVTVASKGHFYVRNEVVKDDDEAIETDKNYPVLSQLIEDTQAIKENYDRDVEELDELISNAQEATDNANEIYSTISTKLNNGELNGATFTPSVNEDGDLSWQNDKNLPNPDTVNIRGPQGIQGPQGEGLFFYEIYESLEEMYADYENVPVGNLVIISTDVDEEINGRYYLRVSTPEHFSLKGDLSGAQGIQGPQGPQGVQGIQGPQGVQGPKPVKGTDYFTEEDVEEIVGRVTEDSISTFNQNVQEKTDEFDEHVDEQIVLTNTLLKTLGLDTDDYSSTETYSKEEIIVYNHQLFESLVDDNIGHLPTDSNYWKLVPVFIESE